MRFKNLKSHLRTYAMVMALLGIWVTFQFYTDGAFLQSGNLSNLFRQMAITGILASGMVLVIVAGQIDLSVGSVVAFLGAILAVLTVNHSWSPGAALAATLGLGAFVGLAQGFLLSYQRIPAFIVTLGGMMAFRGATMWITQNTTITLNENWLLGAGTAYVSKSLSWAIAALVITAVAFSLVRGRILEKRDGLERISRTTFALQMTLIIGVVLAAMFVFHSYEGIPLPVLIMLALLTTIHLLGSKTIWGRHIYAIGGNPEAAFLSGINVKFRIMSVFILMGILSAIGGVVLSARVGSASPDSGQLLELDAIASCVIGGTSLMGGKGSVFGALLGALVIESLNNGMSLANMEPFWQYILKGSVLVIAVWVDVISQDKKAY